MGERTQRRRLDRGGSGGPFVEEHDRRLWLLRDAHGPTRWCQCDPVAVHYWQPGEIRRLVVRADQRLNMPAAPRRRLDHRSLARPGITPQQERDACGYAHSHCLQNRFVRLPVPGHVSPSAACLIETRRYDKTEPSGLLPAHNRRTKPRHCYGRPHAIDSRQAPTIPHPGRVRDSRRHL